MPLPCYFFKYKTNKLCSQVLTFSEKQNTLFGLEFNFNFFDSLKQKSYTFWYS